MDDDAVLEGRDPDEMVVDTVDNEDAEEDAERVAMKQRLERFRLSMKEIKPENRKFDMKAYKKFAAKGEVAQRQLGKHPSGVRLGDGFTYRAELAICGIHGQLFNGIDYEQGYACNAIVLSGRYRGDMDNGSTFTYSGNGGVVDNKRTGDQHFTRGNEALRLAFMHGVPVKVVRLVSKEVGGQISKQYTYDGLYRVTNAARKKEGEYYTCIFDFEGVPGEHCVSGRVQLGTPYYTRHRLANAGEKGKKPPGSSSETDRVYGSNVSAKDLIQLEIERHGFLKKRGNVLNFDISDGKEAIRIPLINDSGIDVPLPSFQYVRHFDHISQAAYGLIEEAKNINQSQGCQQSDPQTYTEEGLLVRTQPEGIKECPRKCTDCNNAVVRTGIRYPLEVFRTEDKGWGVRCAADLPAGAFVCEYMGEILTDEEAEKRVDMMDSDYLFSMDHFYTLKMRQLKGSVRLHEEDFPKLPMSDEAIRHEEYDGHFLVIDAKHRGNVGRFLNHACNDSANLCAQMVLLEGDSGIFHHVGFFATRDIAKYDELCHDYNWNRGIDKNHRCKCKDPKCRGTMDSKGMEPNTIDDMKE